MECHPGAWYEIRTARCRVGVLGWGACNDFSVCETPRSAIYLKILAEFSRGGSGIIYVIKNGLQWKDAPREYGPHKTLYNRFVRWSRLGVFDNIFTELANSYQVAIKRDLM